MYNSTSLSTFQMEILDMISKVKEESQMQEIKAVLASYFAEQVQKEMDKLWDKGIINDEVIEGWKHEHMRTPYII